VVVVLPTACADRRGVPQVSVHPQRRDLIDLKQYSLIHFERLFDNPLALRSIVNTMRSVSSRGDRWRIGVCDRLHRQSHQSARTWRHPM